MCAKKGSKCKALAVCQPGFATADETEYLLKTYNKPDNENRIYGLKFHSRYLNIRTSDHRYDPFFDVAEKYGLPCYLHTDPWGAAEGLDLFQLAKRHPKVTTVFVHMTSNSGKPDDFKAHRQKTIDETKKLIYKQNANGEYEKDNIGRLIPKDPPDANIYLETAWCGLAADHAVMALRELGPDRVLYGSDMPLGPTQDPKGNRFCCIRNKSCLSFNGFCNRNQKFMINCFNNFSVVSIFVNLLCFFIEGR
jgi:predicted TIM-barrel fold metal-dependent hydrolase